MTYNCPSASQCIGFHEVRNKSHDFRLCITQKVQLDFVEFECLTSSLKTVIYLEKNVIL